MKARAIYIDGAFLLHVVENLDIRRLKFVALCELLKRGIGRATRIYGNPFMVMPPKIVNSLMAKPIRMAGFELVASETTDGMDDRVIMQKIRSLHPSAVSEIVLLSGDQDFIPALQQKAEQGMSIYVVATRKPSSRGASISLAYEDYFLSNKFEFIDLAEYVDLIALEKAIPGFRMILESETRDPVRQQEIMDAVHKLERQFPGLKSQRL